MLFYAQLRDRPAPPNRTISLHLACMRRARGELRGEDCRIPRQPLLRILLGSHPNISGAVPFGSVAMSFRPTKPRSRPTGRNIRSGHSRTTGWLYTHIVQPNSMIFSMTTRGLTCIYQAQCMVRSRGPSAPLAAAQHMDACDCNGATVARWRLPTERYRPIPIYAQWLFSEKHRPHTDTICAMCARHLVRPVLGDPIRQWSRDDCGPVNMAMMRRPEEANTTRLTPTGPMGLACCRLPGAT